MRDQKPYCKEGESESYIALGWAIVACVVAVSAWFLILWAIGIIEP